MFNSQAILMAVAAKIQGGSLNIIKVCSGYYCDKLMNITVGNTLKYAIVIATVTGKISVGSCSAHYIEHWSKVPSSLLTK